MQNEPIAHCAPDGGAPHALHEHLRVVADLAAGAIAAGHDDPALAALARLAGLWHDLGKYRTGFQRYIRQVGGTEAHIEGRVPGPDKTHSAAGALHADHWLTQRQGPLGLLAARLLQYVIAGHHAGLDDWHSDSGSLADRLADGTSQREYREALDAAPAGSITSPDLPLPDPRALPITPGTGAEDIPGRLALWVRMLFSALVDADFLDTEAFMNPGAAAARQAAAPSMAELLAAFDDFMADKAAEVQAAGLADRPVNRQRADVLAACRAKAAGAPGTYTLTVPTGGGKTLASLAFALTHAQRHGLRRVVMVIPYTSIIEQTAEVYREVFAPLGEDIVLEHHSNAAEAGEATETARSRLACENWDAPIVVTTSVQLFESLFARRTSRCRKLHALRGSVIVIDEAQLLPVDFLQPVVDVLRLLVRDHGATVVLCTATQPTLTEQRHFGGRGLRGYAPGEVTAIIDDEPALYTALQRVQVRLPASLTQPQSWEVTADALARHDAVLAIVGRRADARELYERLARELPTGREGLWHLSALMCPQHRSEVIADIKVALAVRRDALARGEPATPVHVVSTQLVEAGVDLDFPVVYRALAGLDSIAQAAGRCNREGRLDHGEVHVFVPPKAPPPGLLRQAAQACTLVWDGLDPSGDDDPLALERVSRYFARLYGGAELDRHRIAELLRLEIGKHDMTLAMNFRSAAEKFRLIDNQDAATVFVRWHSPRCRDDVNALLGLLERDGPSRWLMRRLQRYGVTIYQQDLKRLIAAGDVRELLPGLYVQTDSDVFYDPVLGAMLGGAPGDPAAYAV
ncbi:MAG TPA: CRISPR-associated endonuclease Cas3'' [Burkholderiaceae bacterium]|nr:CRISPR-associated endonuclease Cas3'' [Burkholderiaceae bacterium]HNG79952.1 CRISPR-associated endonuclease Cas3'' [Burkholderiaceae bacterium]